MTVRELMDSGLDGEPIGWIGFGPELPGKLPDFSQAEEINERVVEFGRRIGRECVESKLGGVNCIGKVLRKAFCNGFSEGVKEGLDARAE